MSKARSIWYSGGGAWVFGPGQNIFFGQNRSKIIFFAGVTLNSDPVEKWLLGSFFNVKSDSPGHFSTLKADTVQILTLNFEPQVVKKWLPPWNFDFQGGSFFNDFSTLKISLYTPANAVDEVYWFHHSCLTVCPSVCPSVKKWLLYNNSSSVWHTMMILHIYVDLDPRRTSVDFGSKGQRWNLDFKLFYRFRTTAPFSFGIQ